jgi:hypothetical protein
MLRRIGYDQICHYDSARGGSQPMTVVEPGTGIIGSALVSDSPMSWSFFVLILFIACRGFRQSVKSGFLRLAGIYWILTLTWTYPTKH